MIALLARLGYLISVLAFGSVTVVAPPPAASAHRVLGPPHGTLGHDVSAVSCLSTLPTSGSFGVVGTTAGKPFHRSSCLASEYAWAHGLTYRPEYYINLADPGHKSSHWGRGGPRRCHRVPRYDRGCAYDYGYETAAHAYGDLRAIGSKGEGRWWLDVEIDNSWGVTRAGVAANIADIEGALRYVRSRHHTSVGIYTETYWWEIITANTQRLSHVAVWGGGADSKHHARQNCRPHSITGGPALLAQWITGSVDHDVVC